MAREAFMFRHRSYSTLRVVMIDGKLYYPLADIMRLFNLTPSETFDAMADSEGELKIFYVTEEIENVDSKFNFCHCKKQRGKRSAKGPICCNRRICCVDGKLLKDLQLIQTSEMKFVYRWIHQYVEPLMKDKELYRYFVRSSVLKIEDEDFAFPFEVRITKRTLLINDENPKDE